MAAAPQFKASGLDGGCRILLTSAEGCSARCKDGCEMS